MIRKIKLKNFQTHTDLELGFSLGLNVLVAESDKGKSAVIRAIAWFCFHERKDFTTYGRNESAVTLETDTGTITRFRGSRNGYTINGADHVAVGHEQPVGVTRHIHLSDACLQKQHDPHFLLSLTPGQLAKEINKIVALEDIDKSISWLRTQSAKLGTLIDNEQHKLIRYKLDLLPFVALDRKQELLKQLQDLAKRESELSNRRADLMAMESEYKRHWKAVSRLNTQIQYLDFIRVFTASMEARKASKQGLESILAAQAAFDSLPSLDARIAKLEGFIEVRNRRDRLATLAADYQETGIQIKAKNRQIGEVLRDAGAILLPLERRVSVLQGIVKTIREVSYEELDNRIRETAESVRELSKPAPCKRCGYAE